MNPLVLFLPVYRASSTAFVLGLAVLAALDAVRISQAGNQAAFLPILLLALVMCFFVTSLHINRLRHAGRSGGLAALPVIAGILVSTVAAFFGWASGYLAAAERYLADSGNDASPEAVVEAVQDPAFQQQMQQAMQSDPELAMTVISAGAWPSWFGFWIMIALFGIWFALMKRRPA
jgi:protein-S-isoprenylcysteine O-methyltransferase Ste14